jgi:SAM-dependent methyltransferase
VIKMNGVEPMGADPYARVGIAGTWKTGFEAVARMMCPLTDMYALDYGSGTGRSSQFLRELGARVLGVDNDIEMVQKASFLNPDLEFRLVEDSKIPSPDSTFDAALSSFVHVMIPTREEMQNIAQEVSRVLKPSGSYVILTANPEMWGLEYESFFSTLPDDFSGKSGDKIYVQLKENPPIDGYDYLWKEEDYIDDLRKAGFKAFGIKKPVPKNDLSSVPPFIVIKARKWPAKTF